MSLITVDGTPYQFNSNELNSQQPAMPNNSFQIHTQNSFQFELPSDSMQDQPAAASSSYSSTSTSSTLFTSQPPLQFAPSNPQRVPGSSSSTSLQLDFSEFEAELASMEEAKRKEFLEALEVNAQKLREEKNGTAALPHQIGDSKLFHAMVLKQYGKVHHLELDGKKSFQTRKAKQRDARRAKKAEDKADQLEAKSGGAMRKNKHKNRSKGIY